MHTCECVELQPRYNLEWIIITYSRGTKSAASSQNRLPKGINKFDHIAKGTNKKFF